MKRTLILFGLFLSAFAGTQVFITSKTDATTLPGNSANELSTNTATKQATPALDEDPMWGADSYLSSLHSDSRFESFLTPSSTSSNEYVYTTNSDDQGFITKYKASDGSQVWQMESTHQIGSTTYFPRSISAYGGFIYVAYGDRYLAQLDASDAHRNWLIDAGDVESVSASGGFIFTTSSGSNGIIRKYNASNGSLVWGIVSTYVDGSTTYFPRNLRAWGDSLYLTYGFVFVSQLRASDGQRNWIFDARITEFPFTYGVTSLGVSGSHVYVTNSDPSGYITKHKACDGSQVWRIASTYDVNNTSYLPRFPVSPGDNFFYVGYGNRYLSKLAVSDAQREWLFDAGVTIGPTTYFLTSVAVDVTQDSKTFTVTNTNDNGCGSLRQAISEANATLGTDTIEFSIGTGARTIAPTSPLPAITNPVIIDGTTQPGYAGSPIIELNGANASGNGLSITAGDSTVKGLVINRFNGSGIVLQTNGGNMILGNYIGTDVNGTADLGNSGSGILISSATNIIGGTTAAVRNIISGNNNYGVLISGSGATGNIVQGNYVGTTVSGTAALGNSIDGVNMDTASNNTIGGATAAARNIISGNSQKGVGIINGSNNTVSGNYIGTDLTGTVDLGNGLEGVIIASASNNTIGGTAAGAGNLISGNNSYGVNISGTTATGNQLQGNYIGTDVTGGLDLGNAFDGVRISSGANNTLGGTSAGARNIISGNGNNGVDIGGSTATGTLLQGNFIGITASGTAMLGNSGIGVAIGSSTNMVGGTSAGAGNVISGNDTGVVINGTGVTGNQVQGNLIGTDVTGSVALGNSFGGVSVGNATNNTIGGTSPGARNIISGNTASGVQIFGSGGTASGNTVQGNFIGTDVTGSSPLGNSDDGVAIFLSAVNNTIGGTVAGAGNVIAFNGLTGVRVFGPTATGNGVRGNSIFSNNGIGIDLNGNSTVDPNDAGDADTGANNRQNFPVITSADSSAGSTMISGTLNSTASTSFTLEVFSNSMPDASNYGEGKTFLGSTTVTTDASGNTSFSFTTPELPTGTFISATATRNVAPLDTSEFSRCFLVGSMPPSAVTSMNDSGAGSLRQAIFDANFNPGTNTISFDFSGSAPLTTTINLLSPLPTIDDPVIIDGTTAPGYSGSPIIELNGSGAGANANGLTIAGGNSTVKGLVINRFSGRGIVLQTNAGNTIQNCYIGTDVGGTVDMGNALTGVFINSVPNNTIGGTAAATRNVISGNNGDGVDITGSGATNNVVQGNYIGTDATGTADLGNTVDGVFINLAPNNTIGGTAAGAGNVIAFNDTRGVRVSGATATGNSIRGNSIFSNTGLGIDLNGDGVTANDAGDSDSGPNRLQNFPVLTSVTTNATSTTVQGTLNSAAGDSFTIDFYHSLAGDGSGAGRTYFGSTTVMTAASAPSGPGDVAFNVTFQVAVPLTNVVNATATRDATGDTSEFSQTSVPTAIELIEFAAKSFQEADGKDNGTRLEWRTGFEVANLGFNVYRKENGKLTRVNSELIAGSALFAGAAPLTAGRSYTWHDNRGSSTAIYWLEEIDLSGHSEWHGPVNRREAERSSRNEESDSALSTQHLTPSKTLSEITTDDSTVTSSPVQVKAGIAKITAARIEAQSNISSQAAAKISVKREGWYRITQPELAEAGFDVKTDPRLLRLFVDGREMPIMVRGEVDGSFDVTDAVEFYGIGLDAAFSDSRTYWLIAGNQPGLRVKQAKAEGARSFSASFTYAVERRDRTIYFSALRNGERENFFGSVVHTQPVDQSLTLWHIAQTPSTDGIVEVALQGVTLASHRVSVEINGNLLGELNFNGQSQGVGNFSVQHTILQDGPNVVRLVAAGGPSDVSLVDSIRVSYQHRFTADDNSLKLALPGEQQVTIDGFTSNSIRVFDVTNPNVPQEILGEVTQQQAGKGQQANYSVSFAATEAGERKLLAITSEQHPARLWMNQPSNLRESQGAGLIIIAPLVFSDNVKQLAALRRRQGLSVAIADIEDIYDEFSYGQKTPLAIKDFLSCAKNNWKVPAGYALLFGDASLDPKNYLGLGDFDFVPTKLIDAAFLETASDDWLADFNQDGIADLAVGRLPARTVAEAGTMTAKLITYDSSKPSNEALLVSDRNDVFNFENASSQITPLLPGGVKAVEIKRGQLADDAAKAILISALNRGPKIVNYAGHGSADSWRGDLLTSRDASELTNGSRLSMFVMMNCLNGYFHDPGVQSLAESLMKARGGAVAVWASSAMTFPEVQMTVNLEFYRQAFNSRTPRPRLGDAVIRAKASTPSTDVRRTWILFGDPSMTLR